LEQDGEQENENLITGFSRIGNMIKIYLLKLKDENMNITKELIFVKNQKGDELLLEERLF
jgi:hypothetical protein